MSEEEKERFQSSNTCWICEKFIYEDDEKVANLEVLLIRFVT